MQIGIAGLLPEQVRIVQQEFPHHALRFLDKDEQSTARGFAKGCDKVVLMTKFIAHDIQDRVPPSKRVLITGGITKLKQVLQTLPTPVKTTTPVPSAPSANGRGNLVNFKRKHRIKGEPQLDFRPLWELPPGAEFRVERPARCTLKSFGFRIANARTRARKHGVITFPHTMHDGYALIKVKSNSNLPQATDATTQASQDDESMRSLVSNNDTITLPIAAPLLADARASAFWQSAFIETMKQWPGVPVETIAARADEALAAFNARSTLVATQRRQ